MTNQNPLKTLQVYSDLSLRMFAETCGVTDSHVSQIGQGKRSMSTEVLKRMAEALPINMELLT